MKRFFLEHHGSHTFGVFARNLESGGSCLMKAVGGKHKNVFECTSEELEKMRKSKVDSGLDFRVWFSFNNGILRPWYPQKKNRRLVLSQK